MIKKLMAILITLLTVYLVYQFWPIKNTVRMPSSKTINRANCFPIEGGLTPVCKGIRGITTCTDKSEPFNNGEICTYCEWKCFGWLAYEIPNNLK